MRVFPVLLLAAAAAAEPQVLSHEIELVLRPGEHRFESVDRVRVRGPGRLEVGVPEGIEADPAVLELGEGEQEAVVRFRGTVRSPVRAAGGPTWVAGDQTPGTIGPEGTYLVRGFFVPSPAPARFRVTVTVPEEHHAVSQGRRLEERAADARRTVTYGSDAPQDGCVVVAGPWEVEEETIDGVSCRTYLYADDRDHAALLLSSLREEVPRYQALLGPLPDGRFDVVENFFSTGYGFPNFTLLGDTVIRYVCAKTAQEGKTVLPAGYLDHELVHCWLGNGVLVDYGKGNWSEALTTWFTNYGAAVREGTEAEYRRRVSRGFSLRVGPENDYPLRSFKAKAHAFENDIGYGKGSMVFEMLARELGRDAFVGAVRHMVATRRGRALGWDDAVGALSEGVGRDLAEWFAPWLGRTGAPILEVGLVKADGNRIAGTLRQTQAGPAYALRVPVRVWTEAGTEDHVVACASRETAFALEAAAPPRRMEVDPDHRIFRAVPREHVAPCLEAVHTAQRRVGFGDADLLRALGAEVVAPSLPTDAAVLAVGLDPAVRDAVLKGARGQDASLKIGEGSFEFRGETYDRPGDAVLFAYARPEAPGLPVAFFHGNGEAAFARTRYLPYYASDSFVVFRDGRPVARGAFAGDRMARAEFSPARQGEPESIVADLLFLTDPAREGREAGTTASYATANALRGRLFRAGLRHVPWPGVDVPRGRIDGARSLSVGDLALTNVYFPFHAGATPEAAVAFARVVRHPAADPEGALVLLPEDADLALAKQLEEQGASALACVASEATFAARARDTAWQGAIPPALAARWSAEGTDEARAVGALLARSGPPELGIPWIYLAPEASAAVAARGHAGSLEFRVRRRSVSTHNLVAVLGDGGTPGVLLSAHWDGVGLLGDVPAQGASDNAAGVAAVLWAAERLARDHRDGRLRRPVVVALFGAGESGLAGSRQLAAMLGGDGAPIAKPVAAVNVDGIGSSDRPEVFLVGRSHQPALLETFARALEPSGFALGRDLDGTAFEEGSDHWPLHRAGIPAVTVSSGGRGRDARIDTLDRVDVDTVRRVAFTLYRMVKELAG